VIINGGVNTATLQVKSAVRGFRETIEMVLLHLEGRRKKETNVEGEAAGLGKTNGEGGRSCSVEWRAFGKRMAPQGNGVRER